MFVHCCLPLHPNQSFIGLKSILLVNWGPWLLNPSQLGGQAVKTGLPAETATLRYQVLKRTEQLTGSSRYLFCLVWNSPVDAWQCSYCYCSGSLPQGTTGHGRSRPNQPEFPHEDRWWCSKDSFQSLFTISNLSGGHLISELAPCAAGSNVT